MRTMLAFLALAALQDPKVPTATGAKVPAAAHAATFVVW